MAAGTITREKLLEICSRAWRSKTSSPKGKPREAFKCGGDISRIIRLVEAATVPKADKTFCRRG